MLSYKHMHVFDMGGWTTQPKDKKMTHVKYSQKTTAYVDISTIVTNGQHFYDEQFWFFFFTYF